MSRSINLSNMIWMSNDRLDYSEYGDIKEGAFQLFGPVPQYVAGAAMEGLRLLTGDPRGGFNEFMRAAFPVKIGSGLFESLEYADQGMKTGGDLELLSAEEFNGFIATIGGFQTTQKTEVRDRYYDDQRLEAKRAKRKSNLVKLADRAMMDGDWKTLERLIKEMQSDKLSVPSSEFRVGSGAMAQYQSRKNTAQREYDKKYKYTPRH